jgi:NAD(P)-dependent dehydrogenase (short-subunit alcohol dehydrogenase family)
MKNFTNKIVVITGAGSGIGRALAIEFKNMGAKLALNDYNEKSLLETLEILQLKPENIYHSVFDVSQRTAVFDFAEKVVGKFGAVDIVINNAGRGFGGVDFVEVDLDKFEAIMDINFNGVLYGSRAFLPYLEKRPEAALVNISSVFGLTGIIQTEAYVASKFAVNGLTQSLAQAYKHTNLKVQCVYPGGINTNIVSNSIDYTKSADVFKKTLDKSPTFAAQTIIKGIRKKKTRILIGADARFLDFITRLFPVWGCGLINARLAPAREEFKKSKSHE